MPELIERTGIDYDGTRQDTAIVLAHQADEEFGADQRILRIWISPYGGCWAVTPGIAVDRRSVESRNKFVGGLRLTADRTGDCRMLHNRAGGRKCAEMGVGVPVWPGPIGRSLESDGKMPGGHEIAGGSRARLCLRASGQFWPGLLEARSASICLSFPVKGYIGDAAG